MKVFAHSAVEIANDYLHAGYISAPPAPQDFASEYPMLRNPYDSGYAVSVHDALRLAEAPEPAASGWSWIELVTEPAVVPAMVAACVVCVALTAVIVRRRERRVPAWCAAALLVGGLSFAASVGCPTAETDPGGADDDSAGDAGEDATDDDATGDDDDGPVGAVFECGDPDEPAWAGLQPREFADPIAATNVISHALIIDAAVGLGTQCDDPDLALAHLQHAVMIPDVVTSEGFEYARDAYGLDGWGQPLSMGEYEGNAWSIDSPGADGGVGTADDLHFRVATDRYQSEHWTHFLKRLDGVLWLMSRREPERYAHDVVSQHDVPFPDATHYDGVPLDTEFVRIQVVYGTWTQPEEEDIEEVLAEIEAFYETFVTPDDPEPLVMQTWGTILREYGMDEHA